MKIRKLVLGLGLVVNRIVERQELGLPHNSGDIELCQRFMKEIDEQLTEIHERRKKRNAA